MMPMPTTIRQDPDPGAFREAMEMQSRVYVCVSWGVRWVSVCVHATRIPKVMKSWYVALLGCEWCPRWMKRTYVNVPLICEGAVSAWYFITFNTRPTPTPRNSP